MSSLDNADIFGSGPMTIMPGPWQRRIQRRDLPGLDGEIILNMGLRSRTVHQDGRLAAQTAQVLQQLIEQLESLSDGKFHTLVDDFGQTWSNLICEEFTPTTPVQSGRGFWCDYTIRYRQLP